MSDLISRKNAMDLFAKRRDELIGIYGDLGGAMSGVVKLLNELPPEPEIIRCDHCKHRAIDEDFCCLHHRRVKDMDFCSFVEKG